MADCERPGVASKDGEAAERYRYVEREAGRWYLGAMPVEPAEFKALDIQVFSFARPHMRGFHLAWASFFCAFVCWFAFAPLLVFVKASLDLTLSQVLTTNVLSVSGTIACRFLVGPLCDEVGPKRCQVALLAWIACFTLLGAAVDSYGALCAVRFVVGFGGATFVVTQYWTTALFASEIVGTANATTAGWGNLGGGVAQVLMVAVFGFLTKTCGLGHDAGWRLSFVAPALISAAVAAAIPGCSDDTPRGDLKRLVRDGVVDKKTASTSARAGMLDPNSWVLGLQYACSFGVELHVNNTMALYLASTASFGVGPLDAGVLASLFGWMNLVVERPAPGTKKNSHHGPSHAPPL